MAKSKRSEFPVRMIGNNLRRARLVHKIVSSFGDPGDCLLTKTIDLLADIHHYCDAQGWSMGDLVSRAHGHYIEEVCAKCSKCGIFFDPTDEGSELSPDVCMECVKREGRK